MKMPEGMMDQNCLMEVMEERGEMVEKEELVGLEEIQVLYKLELCRNRLNL